MRGRTVVWKITPTGKPDSFDLERDRRPVANDITLDLAKSMARARWTPSDKVVLVQDDGYEEDISQSVKPRAKKV